jgi:hypothetical protein
MSHTYQNCFHAEFGPNNSFSIHCVPHAIYIINKNSVDEMWINRAPRRYDRHVGLILSECLTQFTKEECPYASL